MDIHVTNTVRQIHDLASRVMSGETDPLIAARSIDKLATSIGWGLQEPYLGLKGIVSQADEIADADGLSSVSQKQRERQEFLDFFEESIRAACKEIESLTSELMRSFETL